MTEQQHPATFTAQERKIIELIFSLTALRGRTLQSSELTPFALLVPPTLAEKLLLCLDQGQPPHGG